MRQYYDEKYRFRQRTPKVLQPMYSAGHIMQHFVDHFCTLCAMDDDKHKLYEIDNNAAFYWHFKRDKNLTVYKFDLTLNLDTSRLKYANFLFASTCFNLNDLQYLFNVMSVIFKNHWSLISIYTVNTVILPNTIIFEIGEIMEYFQHVVYIYIYIHIYNYQIVIIKSALLKEAGWEDL